MHPAAAHALEDGLQPVWTPRVRSSLLVQVLALSSETTGASAISRSALPLALELLLRVRQRSGEGALRRAAGDASLLLVVMPKEVISEELPRLKAQWVQGGDT